MSLKICLHGALGRMGQAITAIAASQEAEIASAIDQGDAIAPALDGVDVVIDFSLHNATLPVVEAAAARNLPVVIGTTGHTEDERRGILGLTHQIPIVWSGNYSVGVNVLYYLTEVASRILGPAYDPEIVEAHHRHKVDAPSGTAEGLVEALLKATGWSSDAVVYGRKGQTGARPSHQIGVHALRGGSIIGDHTVLFAGDGERIELTHRAADRTIFAQGALRAAHWVAGKAPGLYSMREVLGFQNPS